MVVWGVRNISWRLKTAGTPAVARRQNNLECYCLTSAQEKEEKTWYTKFWSQFSLFLHQNRFWEVLGRWCSTHEPCESPITHDMGSSSCFGGSLQKSLKHCPDIKAQNSQYYGEILCLNSPKGKKMYGKLKWLALCCANLGPCQE